MPIMLTTSPKRWFGNRNMASNCDVTNSKHQIQITTICRWQKNPYGTFLYTPLKQTHQPSCHELILSCLKPFSCLPQSMLHRFNQRFAEGGPTIYRETRVATPAAPKDSAW